MNDLRMTDMLQQLRAEYGGRAPSYFKLYRAIAEGRVPAFRHGSGGGQWRFKATDIDAVRAGLGLPPVELAA